KAVGGGRPVADPVDGQNRRLIESGEIIAAGSVRKMMIEDFDPPVVAQNLTDHLLGLAGSQAIKDGLSPLGREIRHEPHPYLPAQFQAGVFVIADAIHISNGDSSLLETVSERARRK